MKVSKTETVNCKDERTKLNTVGKYFNLSPLLHYISICLHENLILKGQLLKQAQFNKNEER